VGLQGTKCQGNETETTVVTFTHIWQVTPYRSFHTTSIVTTGNIRAATWQPFWLPQWTGTRSQSLLPHLETGGAQHTAWKVRKCLQIRSYMNNDPICSCAAGVKQYLCAYVYIHFSAKTMRNVSASAFQTMNTISLGCFCTSYNARTCQSSSSHHFSHFLYQLFGLHPFWNPKQSFKAEIKIGCAYRFQLAIQWIWSKIERSQA